MRLWMSETSTQMLNTAMLIVRTVSTQNTGRHLLLRWVWGHACWTTQNMHHLAVLISFVSALPWVNSTYTQPLCCC